MNVLPIIQDFLLPGREALPVTDGIWSLLRGRQDPARYDPRASAYDWIVGSAIYNRLAWGANTKRYRHFASRAVNSASGPLLDAGCGSAIFTAGAYVGLSRPIVLLDRSLNMLLAARERLRRVNDGTLPVHAMLLQADILDLPFRPDCFSTVLSMGMLHLFGNDHATALVRSLAGITMTGGNLFFTSLLAEQAFGRRYLALLHRAGEVAAPRSAAQLCCLLKPVFGDRLDFEREGSMAYVVATSKN
jgi:SAM-dependent methyltransferase